MAETMRNRNLQPLLGSYDRDAKSVARHPDGRVWIHLMDGLVIVHPWAGDWDAYPLPSETLAVVQSWFAQPGFERVSVSLARLTFWALRRAAGRHVSCGRCGIWAERPDPQSVLGRTFDRNLIRSCLQWLYQARSPWMEPVQLAVEAQPIGAVLRLKCGEWEAYVMSIEHAEPGDDPLEAE